MGDSHQGTAEFRGARFTHCDLSGAAFRDCDLTGLTITDCVFGEAEVSGEFDRLVVNDVDVTRYVEAELDRWRPERVLVRDPRTAADHRTAWAAVERLWTATHARLAALPEEVVQARAGEEWSAVETVRHLVFATDAWISRAVLGRERPWHPMGLPAGAYPEELLPEVGLDLSVRPSLAEALAVRAERLATVSELVARLDDEGLAAPAVHPPAPGYPDAPRTVGECLRVVLFEEVEHHRYLERDLAGGPPARPVRSVHVSESVHRPAAEVAAFVRDPANLPRWARGLGGAVECVDGEWFVETSDGRVRIAFAPENPFGVVDHDVTLPGGEVVHVPMRVTADGDGCEVVLTVRPLPGASPGDLIRDVALVEADLLTLKALLETPADQW